MVKQCIAVMAVDSAWGVGKDGDLPWPKNKEDMNSFKETTSNGVVIMGRKTWESIGSKKLPNRINVVISSSRIEGADVSCNGNIADVMETLYEMFPDKEPDEFCIIGGVGLVNATHEAGILGAIYLTSIEGIYGCDIFFDKTILDEYVCYWEETLRHENPKTVLRIYAKGTGENARIQRYDSTYP